MSSPEDRSKRQRRRRNKWARDLANPYFKQKTKDSRKVYDREAVKRELHEELTDGG